MKTTKNNKLAFSLIELSAVILVVGIFVIGVTKGPRIMSETKIKSASSLTKSSTVASINGLALWLDTTDQNNISAGTINLHVFSPYLAIDASRPTYIKNGIGGLPSIKFTALYRSKFQ